MMMHTSALALPIKALDLSYKETDIIYGEITTHKMEKLVEWFISH